MLKKNYELTLYEIEDYKLALAYVWLDLIKIDIEKDLGMDEKIDSIKMVQKLIRGQISKISEEL